jgi:hypothetical protein
MAAGAAAVPTLVLLAGRLPGYAKPGGNLWPPNAQADSVVDQQRKVCLCLMLRVPGTLDQFQYLGWGYPAIGPCGNRRLRRAAPRRPR